jgi:DNA-binding NarL/FixJ family response regulator
MITGAVAARGAFPVLLEQSDPPQCGPPDATALVLIGGPPLMRSAIAALIEERPGLRVASSLDSLVALEESCRVRAPACDVALLDVDDHHGECKRAVDRLLSLNLRCKIVLLCAEPRPEVLICATGRGVDGVVLKESSVLELCEAMADILTGRAVMPPAWRAARRLLSLTPRQFEVLRLIARGYSNEEIAAELGLRRNTVKFHISEIFRRLGVRNRIEAIARLGAVEAQPRTPGALL